MKYPLLPFQYACFACRKVFRKTYYAAEQKPVDFTGDSIRPETIKCPQCSQSLHDVGRFFRAPGRRNVKRWRIYEQLYGLGYRWYTTDTRFTEAFTQRDVNRLLHPGRELKEQRIERILRDAKGKALLG